MTESPPPRDLFIDALRVVAVLMVVIGHWWVITVFWTADGLLTEHALSVISALRPATWLFQVMPLLFVVGGFANASALRSRPDYFVYLRDRMGRLLQPTLAFLGVGVAAGIVLDVTGASAASPWLRAAETAAIPLWFLGLYLLVVALAPAMVAFHRRIGMLVTVGLAAATVLVDALRFGLAVPYVGVLNYGFVWLFCHQLGILAHEGRPRRLPPLVAAGLALAGLAALVVLTTVAGYPTSMVAVPGQPRWNTEPPSVPLLALTLWLVGLASAVQPLAERLLTRPWPRRAMAALQNVVLTVYLWHLAALAPFVAAAYPLGLPQPPTGSAQWWLLRPLWVAGAGVVLLGLVFLFRGFEIHPRTAPETSSQGGTARMLAAGLGVLSLAMGVLGFGVSGFAHLASPGVPLLGFRFNPLQNLLHLAVGDLLLWSTQRGPVAGWTAVASAVIVFGGVGVAGLLAPEAVRLLAVDRATAVLHLVMVGGVLLVLGALLSRRLISPSV